MTPAELKQAREAMLMTQKGLAEKLDLSTDHISRMERGTVRITRTIELAVMAIQEGLDKKH